MLTGKPEKEREQVAVESPYPRKNLWRNLISDYFALDEIKPGSNHTALLKSGSVTAP